MAKQKAKGSEVKQAPGINDDFEAQLTQFGIGDSLKLADESDTFEVISTGFPGLDLAIDDKGINLGLPRSRHSEWFSKKTQAGKTSIILAIAQTFQRMGLRTGIVDIEPSVTYPYLKTLGFITDKNEADARGLYAIRLMQPRVILDECETKMVYAEKVLDTVAKAANLFDLLIVDSVDALVTEVEANKESGEAAQPGTIAKLLRNYFRKNSTRRAHVAWLNHANPNIGYGGGYNTSGGGSVPRYSSLRFELAVIEQLKESDDKPPYGFTTRIQLVKNRLGANWRFVDLTYIFHEGFSKDYDYFATALKMGIIWKVGGWFYFGGEGKNVEERKKSADLKVQGKLNMYKLLQSNADAAKGVFDKIKTMIDGEAVEPEVGVQQGDDAAVEAAEKE